MVERDPHGWEGLIVLVRKDITGSRDPALASRAMAEEAMLVVETEEPSRVETEEPSREFLARQLTDDGFEVFAADEACKALELVEAARPAHRTREVLGDSCAFRDFFHDLR